MNTDAREVLRARASALAREPEQEDSLQESLQVVEFLLASEHYAVDLADVCEVYPLKELTPLPCTPPFVVGIINVRGQILTVIDVREFFDLPRAGLTDLNKVIIVRVGGMELGILADAVLGARTIPLHEIQAAPPTLTGLRAEYLRGVTLQPLVILDAAAILADEKLIVQEEVGP